MQTLRTDEAIHGLMGVTARMAGVVAWLIVAVFHLALVLTLLVSAWLWRLTPATVSRVAQALIPDRIEASALATTIYIAVPLVLGTWLYVRAWRWTLARLVLRFALRAR